MTQSAARIGGVDMRRDPDGRGDAGADESSAAPDPAVVYAATGIAGRRVSTIAGNGVVSHQPIGHVSLPSGRLVARDPTSWMPEPPVPFVQPVAPGRHPVELRVVHTDDGDARTVCATIHFAPAEPSRWEVALLPGQDVSEVRPGEIVGYPVDGGIGCFCDVDAGGDILTMVEDWLDEAVAEFALHKAMAKNYTHTWDWANVPLGDDLNVVVFSTGLGDGTYPVWFGYSGASDLPVVALNDFGLIS